MNRNEARRVLEADAIEITGVLAGKEDKLLSRKLDAINIAQNSMVAIDKVLKELEYLKNSGMGKDKSLEHLEKVIRCELKEEK